MAAVSTCSPRLSRRPSPLPSIPWCWARPSKAWAPPWGSPCWAGRPVACWAWPWPWPVRARSGRAAAARSGRPTCCGGSWPCRARSMNCSGACCCSRSLACNRPWRSPPSPSPTRPWWPGCWATKSMPCPAAPWRPCAAVAWRPPRPCSPPWGRPCYPACSVMAATGSNAPCAAPPCWACLGSGAWARSSSSACNRCNFTNSGPASGCSWR